MALEVNHDEPSAFSLSMNTLQGVGGERMESIAMDTLQGVLMARNKKGREKSRPAYRYRLINRKGFKTLDVSRQKQHFSTQ